MKSFNDTFFSNRFTRVSMATCPAPQINSWEVAGTTWRRDRHSYYGQTYSFQCDVYTVTHAGRKSWSLLQVVETWWDEARTTVVRNTHWGRLLHGNKEDVFSWFRDQEESLQG